jgi:hypothetical protein
MTADWPMILPVLVFISCVIAAHIESPTEYNWRQNTISELAGQNVIPSETGGNPIIMRLCYGLFGSTLIIGLLFHQWQRRTASCSAVPLYLCGSFSILSAVFSTKYDYGPTELINWTEVRLHLAFAFLGILSVLIAMIFRAVLCIDRRIRAVNIASVLVEMMLFVLFVLIMGWQGLFQRLMFAVGLLWIATVYSRA